MKKKDEKGKEYDAEMDKAQREGDEEGEENETEEEEEAEKGCAKKSEDLTADDLEKSLNQLDEYIEKGDTPTRKQTLLEKAQKSELNKSEQDELHVILGGGEAAPEDTLTDKVEKAMEPSEDLQKALDVSDFLHATHDEAVKVNTMLAETIEKSDARQHSFNLILAKSTSVIGNLIKSLDERLAGLEGQPARAPKSQGAKPLKKSFAGESPKDSNLSKSEIQNEISSMIEKSCEAGQAGLVNGIDLIKESSKFETTNQLHPTVMAMVQQKRSAVH